MIGQLEVIEATTDEFLEMAKSPDWTPISDYPLDTKTLHHEIGMFEDKRVVFNPFGYRYDENGFRITRK